MSTDSSNDTSDDQTRTTAADIVREHREAFETVAEHAEDPERAERFGRRPLRLLEEGDDE